MTSRGRAGDWSEEGECREALQRRVRLETVGRGWRPMTTVAYDQRDTCPSPTQRMMRMRGRDGRRGTCLQNSTWRRLVAAAEAVEAPTRQACLARVGREAGTRSRADLSSRRLPTPHRICYEYPTVQACSAHPPHDRPAPATRVAGTVKPWQHK